MLFEGLRTKILRLIAEYSQPNYLPIFQARAIHAKHPKDILTILNNIDECQSLKYYLSTLQYLMLRA
ncbi:hypothetical protein PsalN5692_01136 [Piscirickettsia salmonis]|uniref:hypothetical protein n=2 Tax=Piscirickettsia salmonis TaxID=1238 RepID=UPI001E62260C|nr:hypothetical protein [Piscirickettsia salmonis]QGP49684.1 hypothetical protein PsalN5692_01136 [Piscirickettsia salmonis]